MQSFINFIEKFKQDNQLLVESIIEAFYASHKYRYIGICNKLRELPGGEGKWQYMMQNKKATSINEIANLIVEANFLDDDETIESWFKCELEQDPECGCYYSKWGTKDCIFIQTSGFEYVFVSDLI